MADLGYGLFDADNHYYEATDAFTRHIDPKLARRGMQWVEVEGKTRLMVNGKINRFIPNPVFDPIAKPGCLDEYFRGRSPANDIRGAFGDLEPIRPEYRDRDARIALMDEQAMEGCFLFPTLGVGMEEALLGDPEAAHGVFHAFNRWLEDDWGYAYKDRIFTAPYFTLLDPEAAVAELDRVLALGVRVIVMRAGPIMAPTGGRSPGDPVYDPFWARINEAGITVAYHSGEAGYGRYLTDWGESSEFEAFRRTALYGLLTSDRPIFDTMGALICHGVFTRFPNVRVATIESGSTWVPELLKKLKKAWSMTPAQFPGGSPIEQFKRHVWVAPYYEDPVRRLADYIGADHVLFGSDYPHAEGIAVPSSFADELKGFTDDEVRLIMRENALSLTRSTA